MSDFFRRDFIKQVVVLGALATVLPGVSSSAENGTLPNDAIPIHTTRIILLGTDSGPGAKKYTGNSASLLVVDGRPYLIDVGYPAARQLILAGFDMGRIDRVFITHHHADHNADLPNLINGIWRARSGSRADTPQVQIYGPPSTKFLVKAALDFNSVSERVFSSLGNQKLSTSMIEAHEFNRDGVVYSDDLVRVTAVENTHWANMRPESPAGKAGDKSYSYRFDTPAGSVVFTGDTGPSTAVTKLADHADVLVSEVAFAMSGMGANQGMGANAPQSAGPMAAAGGMGAGGMDAGGMGAGGMGAGGAGASAPQSAGPMAPQGEGQNAAGRIPGHMNQEDAGKMAAQAQVGTLLLNHYTSSGNDETDMKQIRDEVQKYYSGPILLGKDFMEFNLVKLASEASTKD